VVKILQESSKKEGHADKKLNEIAEGTLFTSGVNAQVHSTFRFSLEEFPMHCNIESRYPSHLPNTPCNDRA
jgi:hypothetical protein